MGNKQSCTTNKKNIDIITKIVQEQKEKSNNKLKNIKASIYNINQDTSILNKPKEPEPKSKINPFSNTIKIKSNNLRKLNKLIKTTNNPLSKILESKKLPIFNSFKEINRVIEPLKNSNNSILEKKINPIESNQVNKVNQQSNNKKKEGKYKLLNPRSVKFGFLDVYDEPFRSKRLGFINPEKKYNFKEEEEIEERESSGKNRKIIYKWIKIDKSDIIVTNIIINKYNDEDKKKFFDLSKIQNNRPPDKPLKPGGQTGISKIDGWIVISYKYGPPINKEIILWTDKKVIEKKNTKRRFSF